MSGRVIRMLVTVELDDEDETPARELVAEILRVLPGAGVDVISEDGTVG